MKFFESSIERGRSAIKKHTERYQKMGNREKTRFLVLAISLILLADYLMFCYLADKNIFNVFPSLPKLDSRTAIHVYVPDREAKTILKETRNILIPDNKEVFAAMLYKAVALGSMFDNTVSIVPVKTFVRRAWVTGDSCVIDIDFESSRSEMKPIPGSYAAFSKSLEKTIIENIHGVKKVYLVVNGIQRAAW